MIHQSIWPRFGIYATLLDAVDTAEEFTLAMWLAEGKRDDVDAPDCLLSTWILFERQI